MRISDWSSDVCSSDLFEYMQRAAERLKIVVPLTLAIIFALLYAIFRRFDEAALIMATLPFALTGGIWLLYLLGYDQRSEERRVGKECVRTCRYRWSPSHLKQ